MQLINRTQKKVNLAEKLALAATALVGGSVQAQENDAEWDYSTSLLAYSEVDRVTAGELIVNADKDFSDTSNLRFKLVLDSLTGSSANGAIEQATPQTFTRVSANGQYQVGAFETPLDDNFRDTRVQFNVGWTDALAEDSRYTLGTNLSKEVDYISIGVNGEYARDFYNKNTTLSAGVSFVADIYKPLGDIPIAFSSMIVDQGQFASQQDFLDAVDTTRNGSSDSVTTKELLLGWTQVVNRRMLMQFNYSFSNVNGYLTDPYKILSVVNTLGVTQDLIYENRPDSKAQHSFFSLMKYHLDESVFDASYRFFTNDWGITSHTIDTHWHFYSSGGSFWEPHLRFYQQAAADFYTPFLAQGSNLPKFASADYRIGEMTAMTVGLKYGFQMDDGDRAEIRLEYYKQSPTKANQPEGIANLDGLDLYPEIDALILQFNYYF